MAITLEILKNVSNYFPRTICNKCNKKIIVTYVIPFLCSNCEAVLDKNTIFLHTRVKFRYKFHMGENNL